MATQSQLLADLNVLTETQIETGLDAGVWGETTRPIVEAYLSRMKFERAEAEARAQTEALRSAVVDARSANLKATIGLIFAIGAMVAAMAAASVAFLAMRGVSI